MTHLVDPDIDPAATYVLDPADVAGLLTRVHASPTAPFLRPVAPFTLAPVAPVPQTDPADVPAAATEARCAQESWAALPVLARAGILLRAHDALLARQGEILDLVQIETGKARVCAYEEVADVANLLRHYGHRGDAYLRPEKRRGLVPGLTQVRVHHHPIGLVGVIVPWNYPLSLFAADVVPALLAGNAVLARPDRQTVLTAAWFTDLLVEAGLPSDVLQLLVGPGATVGKAVIDAVDFVAFTGSNASGRVVAAQAGARMIPTSLELGGKNAMYVTDDSDFDAAAECAVRACFASAGQLCLSIERLVLHTAIAQPFLRQFLARVRSLRLGTELTYGADVGSLVSPEQLARVQAHVDDAVARGARVLTGGQARPDIGPLVYAPTVLADVPAEAAVYAEETFGPVVSVYTVADDAEAIEFMNNTDNGLNSAVWTADLRRGRAIADRLETGMVNINEGYVAAWASPAAPAGGIKASGLGGRHGREGLLQYTRTRTVAAQRGAQTEFGLGRLYGLEDETWTGLMTRVLKIMKAVRLS